MMVMTMMLTSRIMKKMKDYEVHAGIEHLVSLYAGNLLDLHKKFLSPMKQKQSWVSTTRYKKKTHSITIKKCFLLSQPLLTKDICRLTSFVTSSLRISKLLALRTNTSSSSTTWLVSFSFWGWELVNTKPDRIVKDLVDISLPRRGAHDGDHDEEEEEEEKPDRPHPRVLSHRHQDRWAHAILFKNRRTKTTGEVVKPLSSKNPKSGLKDYRKHLSWTKMTGEIANQMLESDWCKREMDDRSEVAIEDGRKLCLKVWMEIPFRCCGPFDLILTSLLSFADFQGDD